MCLTQCTSCLLLTLYSIPYTEKNNWTIGLRMDVLKEWIRMNVYACIYADYMSIILISHSAFLPLSCDLISLSGSLFGDCGAREFFMWCGRCISWRGSKESHTPPSNAYSMGICCCLQVFLTERISISRIHVDYRICVYLGICAWVYRRVYVYIYVCMCVCVYTCACMDECIGVSVYICGYVCVDVCICMHVCVCACLFVC